MKPYLSSKDEVLQQLDSNSRGLTGQEAKRRLEENGPNRLAEGKKESLIHRFLKELADPMIIILIVAAVISGITAVYSGDSFADVIIIMVVVLINAILGVVQESKAEKAIAALQEIAAATSKVLRDGEIVTLPSQELVPGDVVILEAGDAVPADGRILDSSLAQQCFGEDHMIGGGGVSYKIPDTRPVFRLRGILIAGHAGPLGHGAFFRN